MGQETPLSLFQIQHSLPTMRETILAEIRRMAAENGGRSPGVTVFTRVTGIPHHQWLGVYWARWNDALVEAGLKPNELQRKLDSDAVLDMVIEATRHYGRVPTRPEWGLYRRDHPTFPTARVIERHFGLRAELIALLAKRAAEDSDCRDIASLLPAEGARKPKPNQEGALREGFVYLIKSGDFYKIGRSDDLERRVKEIRVALPDKATLVHSIRTDDPAGIEAYWHRRFADKRANGEWFRLTSLDVVAFKKRKYQ